MGPLNSGSFAGEWAVAVREMRATLPRLASPFEPHPSRWRRECEPFLGRVTHRDDAPQVRRDVEPPADNSRHAGLAGHGLLPDLHACAFIYGIDSPIAAGDIQHVGRERIGRPENAVIPELPALSTGAYVECVDISVVARSEDRCLTNSPDDQLFTG